jgi:RNA polymerase sigma factor (sigma-70 family)
MSAMLREDALAGLGPAVRALVGHLLSVRPGDPDLEDCTSEVFRRALEGRGRLESGAALRPWLLGIARHVALDARRARRRALLRREPERAGADDAALTLDRLADAGPGPEERVEVAERTQRVQIALGALPDGQQRALLLHAEGLGYREIGEQLSVPLGTICTWIARGRQSLALALTDPAHEERP